ncbi:metallophosphoesterase family protein [Nanoarchaeota archaeon]
MILAEFKLSKSVSNKPIYIVSDLHIGSGLGDDDFKHNQWSFRKFLDHVKSTKGILILNGDIFELWQTHMEFALAEYWEMIEFMNTLPIIYIYGNHDLVTKGFRSLTYKYHRIKDVIHIEHGHRADLLNANPSIWVKFFVKIVGWLERFWDPDIDEIGLSKVEQLNKETEHAKTVTTPANKKYHGNLNEYRKYAFSKKMECVILGHTHRPETATKESVFGRQIYINSGSWVEHKNTYVEIIEDKVSLRRWI